MRPATAARGWQGRVLALVTAMLVLTPSGLAAPILAGPDSSDHSYTIYLMTIGPGDAATDRFGHNALLVHEDPAGTDLIYNYGSTSFRKENFPLHFIQDRMMFWLEVSNLDRAMRVYQHFRRSVSVQELDLSPAQRTRLAEFLKWNAEEEHKYYRYDYYLDNCSTRVRDAIDWVVNGALRAATEPTSTGETYRSHTRRLTTYNPAVYTALEVALGPAADRALNGWEEMFLPAKVAAYVGSLQVPDEAGGTKPLAKPSRVLYAGEARPLRSEPPMWWPGYLAAGLGFGALIAWLGSAAAVSATARHVFGALAGLWCLVSGLAGLVLAGLWAFTDHAVAPWNQNLLLLTPLALVLLPLVTQSALGRDGGWRRVSPGIALAIAVLSAVALVLSLFHWQYTLEIVAFALPANIGLYLGLRFVAGQSR